MSSTASIDDALVSNSDRYLTVVARVTRADPSVLAEQAEDERVETLKEHATQTQASLQEFAKRRDGVAVVNSFWIANAVVLQVDRERVELDELARVPGVERLHANFEVEMHGGGQTSGDTPGAR